MSSTRLNMTDWPEDTIHSSSSLHLTKIMTYVLVLLSFSLSSSFINPSLFLSYVLEF